MVDEAPPDDRPAGTPPQEETSAAPPAAAPGASRPPITPLDLTRRAPASGVDAEGCRRPALIGAVAIALVLVLLLVAGLQLTRRTVWLTTDRAMTRVRQAARDAPLEPVERERLLGALDRFEVRLGMMDEPYPAMGAFLGRVQRDLDDGRLSRDEAAALTELVSDLAAGRVPP